MNGFKFMAAVGKSSGPMDPMGWRLSGKGK